MFVVVNVKPERDAMLMLLVLLPPVLLLLLLPLANNCTGG